jgi:hypothetical protein
MIKWSQLIWHNRDGDGKAGAFQVLSQLFKTTFELPPRIQAICWAQFWAWIGMKFPATCAILKSNIE